MGPPLNRRPCFNQVVLVESLRGESWPHCLAQCFTLPSLPSLVHLGKTVLLCDMIKCQLFTLRHNQRVCDGTLRAAAGSSLHGLGLLLQQCLATVLTQQHAGSQIALRGGMLPFMTAL
eukprot:5676393-Amphidinium_carterae.2